MPGKFKFQCLRLNNDSYRHWLAPDPANPHRAKCKPCTKTFNIAAMEESALRSHAKSAKHNGNVKEAVSSTMKNFLVPSLSEQSVDPPPSQSTYLHSVCKKHELVTDAEILWTLKVTTPHYSYSSCSQTNYSFRRMFSGSEVVRAFSCGEQKTQYYVCHGLRPFFLSSLQRGIDLRDYYVVFSDESLNEQKQMDIHIRYWDASHKVAMRYFTSEFMGHSKAEDIEEKLLGALGASPTREDCSAVDGWTECELGRLSGFYKNTCSSRIIKFDA